MASSIRQQPIFSVHISDVPCHSTFNFDNICSKAQDFYKSFLPKRSYQALRDDSPKLDRTWAILSFTSQNDALKCAQWLLHGPITFPGAPPSFTGIRVMQRVQASTAALEQAAHQSKEYEKNLAQWQASADSPALDSLSRPSLTLRAPPTDIDRDRGRDRGRERSRRSSDSDSPRDHSRSPPPRRRSKPKTGPSEPRPGTASASAAAAPAAQRPKPTVSLFPSKKLAEKTAHPKRIVEAKPVEPPKPEVPDAKKIETAKKVIREALSHGMTEETAHASSVMCSELSHAIIEALLALGLESNKFTDKVRLLSFNLRKNGDLQAAVLDGTTPPEVLVKMTSEDMMTKEQAETKRRIEQQMMDEVTVDPTAISSWHNTAAALEMKRSVMGNYVSPSPDKEFLMSPNKPSAVQPLPTTVTTAAAERPLSADQPLPVIDSAVTNNLVDISLPLSPRAAVTAERLNEGAGGGGGGEKAVLPHEQPQQPLPGAGPAMGPASIYKRPGMDIPEAVTRAHKSVRFDSSVKNDNRSVLGESSRQAGGAVPSAVPLSHTTSSSLSLYVPPAATIPQQQRHATPAMLPHDAPLAWGPPLMDTSEGPWHPPIALYKNKILNGKLAWNGYEIEVQGVDFSPMAFIRLPPTLQIKDTTSIAAMTQAIRDTGAQPWHMHRFWLVGPSMPDVDWRSEPGPDEQTVGRILVTVRGDVLEEYEDGWKRDVPHGWEIFIMPPTEAACTAASAVLQEVDAARQSHALLAIAVPHYWGILLPKGRKGLEIGEKGSRIRVSAAGTLSLHKLPSVLNFLQYTTAARIANLEAEWHKVFGSDVRLFAASNAENDISLMPPHTEDEKDLLNLERYLNQDMKVLVAQESIPPNLELCLAAPRESMLGMMGSGGGGSSPSRPYVILGVWRRKEGAYGTRIPMEIRDPAVWESFYRPYT